MEFLEGCEMMTHVLTLRMDAASQAHFEALRRRYFPPERNQIPAHLSLFHTLPKHGGVVRVLEVETGVQERFRIAVTGVRSLGKGVAYRLSSGVLMALHGRLSEAFREHLTAQDRQRLEPHVVVQNKVTPAAARELLAELERGLVPMEVEAVGLDLWNYLGGPWELARTFPFGREGGSSLV